MLGTRLSRPLPAEMTDTALEALLFTHSARSKTIAGTPNPDSPLEGDGFKLPVPPGIGGSPS
jgi:hypothetical protein